LTEATSYYLYFLVCIQSEFDQLEHSFSSDSDRCSHINDLSCFINVHLQVGTTYSHNETITRQGLYYFILANCEETVSNTVLQLNCELVNPGGQQLGTEEIPLPIVYESFLVVWFILLVMWVVNWVQFRHYRLSLHRFICILPILKVISMGCNVAYWYNSSIFGTMPLWGTIMNQGFVTLHDIFLFIALMLIGKGWGITRASLIRPETLSIIVTVVTWAFAALCYRLYGGYYLFAVVIVFIVLLKYMFTGVTQNMFALKSQLLIIRQYRVTSYNILNSSSLQL